MKNFAHAEVMGRMNEGFHSDELKRQIRDFNKRKEAGMVETYEHKTGEAIEYGNKGLSKQSLENEDREARKAEAVFHEVDSASLGDKLKELEQLKAE